MTDVTSHPGIVKRIDVRRTTDGAILLDAYVRGQGIPLYLVLDALDARDLGELLLDTCEELMRGNGDDW